MPVATYLAMLVMGLAGGIHCAAMCGGFIASVAGPRPDAWQRLDFHRDAARGHRGLMSHPALWMNLGRLTTYALLGALFAGIASVGRVLPWWMPVQTALFAAANVVLILYGIGLIGREAGARRIEAAGMRVQARVERLLGALPLSGLARRYAIGLVWGFVPCGLVYSALAVAALTGDAGAGALVMLSFGAGTLPSVVGAQWVIASARRFAAGAWQKAVRLSIGVLLLAFGAVGLARAAGFDAPHRLLSLCLPGHG